jgi:hypothetical protein
VQGCSKRSEKEVRRKLVSKLRAVMFRQTHHNGATLNYTECTKIELYNFTRTKIRQVMKYSTKLVPIHIYFRLAVPL